MAFIDFTGKAIPANAAKPSNAEIIRVVADGPAAPLQEDKPIKMKTISRDTLNESAAIGEPTGIGTIAHQTKSVPVPAYAGASFGPAIIDKEDNRPHSGSNAAPVVVNGGANGNWL